MPNCRYTKETLMEFIDNELSINETNSILEHLANCNTCKAIVNKQVKLKKLLRRTQEKTPPNFSFKLDKNIYKCFEVENKLIEFIDGGLSQDERKEISAHLLECSYCRGEYDRLRQFNSKIKNSLEKTPYKNALIARKLVMKVLCENKKHTIVTSSAIASCVMFASLISFSSIDNKELTEVSFKKEEVVQEKAEQIVLKDLDEETYEDSQKLIYEIK